MSRRILLIAGSDSSGGAGLEGDQKTIAAHGCYAMTATTALTAQNTQGVRAIHETPPEFLQQQIAACVEDIGVDVVKIGMMASETAINVICDALQGLTNVPTVVDPVMVATTGAKLLPESAIKTLIARLLPLATVLTPNVPEARFLLDIAGHKVPEITGLDTLVELAHLMKGLGPKYILLKGGHAPLTEGLTAATTEAERAIVADVLVGDEGKQWVLRSEYSTSKNTHGTGCSLASAIASNIALGKEVPEAVKASCQFVEVGIRTSPNLGKGSGPINHFHSAYNLPFAPGYFIDYLIERVDVKDFWAKHVEHDFVMQLAKGTLEIDRFTYYLVQDYLFLIQFARANALAAYKGKTMDEIRQGAEGVASIMRETLLHVTFCGDYGLTEADLEAAEESQACTAYTRYVLDVGQTDDWLALQIALLPCLLGYGVIGTRLLTHPDTVREGNRFWPWIETYSGADYQGAVKVGRELIENAAMKLSPSRLEELVAIFIHATKMEIGFWEMGSAGA